MIAHTQAHKCTQLPDDIINFVMISSNMSYSNISLNKRRTTITYDDCDGRQARSHERHRISCTISSIREWFPSFKQLDRLFEIEASSTCCDTNNGWDERPFIIYAYQRLSISLILTKFKTTWTYSFLIRTRNWASHICDVERFCCYDKDCKWAMHGNLS